jgi:hypothetical protein
MRGVHRGLDRVEGVAPAEAGPVVMIVVDDQDVAVLAPAAGAGRSQTQADRGDDRE